MFSFFRQRQFEKEIEFLRKAVTLLNVGKRYYLEIWVREQKARGVVDIHPDLYRQGVARCVWAETESFKRVREIIQGGNLDRNYNRLLNRYVRGLNIRQNSEGVWQTAN